MQRKTQLNRLKFLDSYLGSHNIMDLARHGFPIYVLCVSSHFWMQGDGGVLQSRWLLHLRLVGTVSSESSAHCTAKKCTKYKYKNTQVQECTNTRILKYKNRQIQECNSSQIHKFSDGWSILDWRQRVISKRRSLHCKKTKISKYTNTQIRKYTNTQIHRWLLHLRLAGECVI